MNSESSQTSNMNYFDKIVKGFYPLTILAKCSNEIFDRILNMPPIALLRRVYLILKKKAFFAFYDNNNNKNRSE